MKGESLEILSMSLYEYILYLTIEEKFILDLTYERGFGVYSHSFEPKFEKDIASPEAQKQILKLRDEFMKAPEDFVSKHSEIIINSKEAKLAQAKWLEKHNNCIESN